MMQKRNEGKCTPRITRENKNIRARKDLQTNIAWNPSLRELCEGYTLIETLIVMAIMAILASMLLAYNNSSTGRVALYADQATVAGVLGRAKALALEKWSPGSISACAYGVHFNADGSYLIYQDMPTGSPPSCNNPHDYTYGASDTVIQTLRLSGGVEFSALPNPPDVYFVPPYFTTSTSGTPTITLRAKGTAATASVEVTAGGAITSL